MASLASLFTPESYDPRTDPPEVDPYAPVKRPFTTKDIAGVRPLAPAAAKQTAQYRYPPFAEALSEMLANFTNAVGGKPLYQARQDNKALTGSLPVVNAGPSWSTAKGEFGEGNYGSAALNAVSAGLDMLPGGGIAEAAIPFLMPATKAITKTIRASHASPHSFDKFRLSSETSHTGEGAQSFGHGLYFGENPATVDNYWNKFKRQMEYQDPVGKFISAGQQLQKSNPEMLDQYDTQQLAGYFGHDFNPEIQKALADPQRVEAIRNLIVAPPGPTNELAAALKSVGAKAPSRYDVDIHADPRTLLDLDTPIAQQTPEIWNSLHSLFKSYPSVVSDLGTDTPSRAMALLDKSGQTGDETYRGLADIFGSPEEVSEALRKHGTPGSKYLDEGSRTYGDALLLIDNYGSREKALEIAQNRLQSASMGDLRYWEKMVKDLQPQTRNFVVFNDRIIDIVKKYGIAGAVSAGMITEEMARQMEEQGMGGT